MDYKNSQGIGSTESRHKTSTQIVWVICGLIHPSSLYKIWKEKYRWSGKEIDKDSWFKIYLFGTLLLTRKT